MKSMVIGLGPEYNYDVENHSVWGDDNTKYASNHGASLISRTLMRFFDADYIDDFTEVETYKKTYDLCIIAFATHVTDWRDVSVYTNFVKKLGIKTIAFSLGIQDYASASFIINSVHSSLKELLVYVIKSSGYIGVRGPHTASVLIKSGFKPEEIVRIGCPTLFSPLRRDLRIIKKEKFSKPLIVYHRTMAGLNKLLIGGADLLGQDFLDEVVFDALVPPEQIVKKTELEHYKNLENGIFALDKIKERGIFLKTFNEWFDEIKKYDFVLGARLHGCIAALIQGIPAVMIARDIRVQEIAEFYKIPYIKYEEVGNMTIEDIYNMVDFTEFNKLYKHRFDNFIKLMHDLKVNKQLSFQTKCPESYWYNETDLNANTAILFKELNQLSIKVSRLESIAAQNEKKVNKVIKAFHKLPGVKLVKEILK
ncbi:polysaccharide pyruvyl transferase family protein [Hyunsoonleella sp. SJ7]|uniref:Polysaccharide pyruvyl transferase family protein n=1 Tax=Hyunsoonleella aquatilis TaxID=2762758 RepID=A0A923H901_9FLAO|nr:polysaccharide pyruvyl transferase family protein [Hyunsoonleella aquatilis]MBC3757744.1 polysaccharide pyruvyl transferase family protein [Hyunsoonleella aquatilis]